MTTLPGQPKCDGLCRRADGFGLNGRILAWVRIPPRPVRLGPGRIPGRPPLWSRRTSCEDGF